MKDVTEVDQTLIFLWWVRAQQDVLTWEMNKTYLHTSPSTEVTREPYRQSPGRTRDLLVSRSLILPRPTNSRGKPVWRMNQIKKLFQILPRNFNCNSQWRTDVPTISKDRTDSTQSCGSWEDPRRKEESRWTTLYNYFPATCIFVHYVHLYSLAFMFTSYYQFR